MCDDPTPNTSNSRPETHRTRWAAISDDASPSLLDVRAYLTDDNDCIGAVEVDRGTASWHENILTDQQVLYERNGCKLNYRT